LTVKGDNKCNNWPDFPTEVFGATGGLIGSTVIICGGWKGGSLVDECYSLTFDKATLVTHMSVGRAYAASIVLNDKTLWITGGYGGEYLASTEYVTVIGTMLGPDLPMTLDFHAMVAINSTFSMVIGGYSSHGSTVEFESLFIPADFQCNFESEYVKIGSMCIFFLISVICLSENTTL
jgi:hypothetical protein